MSLVITGFARVFIVWITRKGLYSSNRVPEELSKMLYT